MHGVRRHLSSKKVLIVLSDANAFPLRKNDGSVVDEETGFFLSELAKPLMRLLDAGYEVTFASPQGKQPNIDPLSKSTPLAFLGMWWQKRKEEDLIKKMELENNILAPRPFSSISDQELESFAGVFIPGGHAPLTDLGADAELGRILAHFHSRAKPTAAICHGPYAFLSTKPFAYTGYKMISWSDTEEKLVETLKGGEIEKVQSSLANAGAEMVDTIGAKTGAISVDRELVTGANPMAAAALGDKFVEMLNARH
ncbi:ThiJ/PfpI family protein [Exidia glandulosa HHB12029]|uniref:D-lactate dehydratase n=1 Tax=Exidia glandulosa HHB12029 TaxID=1314781 RepID=A0A165Q7Z7_EXIGL|nr:ThiJ/PfpI family protein [Exidia glandulosa HHB12029]